MSPEYLTHDGATAIYPLAVVPAENDSSKKKMPDIDIAISGICRQAWEHIVPGVRV